MDEHKGHNEIRDDGVVHVCSCGWVSRPCFSSAIASCEGMDHRESMKRPDRESGLEGFDEPTSANQ